VATPIPRSGSDPALGRSALNPGVARREVFAWAMYDFANSGYTTVVLTAVFNAYFVSAVAGNAEWATFAWTAALSVSYLIVMVVGPLLGAWADAHAAKKRLLAFSTLVCIFGTAALALTGPGAVAWAVVFIIVSNVAYAVGENLCAAFLPELARPEALGKVSGWGWSLGYFGGILALAISLAWVMTAPARGSTTSQAVPGTMLITAAIFALASLPTFLWLKERAQPAAVPGARAAFARLLETARSARRYRDLLLVFACGVCYQAGVATVIALAAIYAEQVMGFKTQDTILLILVVNVTAAIGAFGFGYLQDSIGHVRSLALTLVGWIVMVLIAGFAQGPGAFWVAANLRARHLDVRRQPPARHLRDRRLLRHRPRAAPRHRRRARPPRGASERVTLRHPLLWRHGSRFRRAQSPRAG
jgi:UMF1 family MFS transporter